MWKFRYVAYLIILLFFFGRVVFSTLIITKIKVYSVLIKSIYNWLTDVDCTHPGPIENGRVIVVNQSTTYGSAVEYHCVPQFQRIGPYLRKCLEDGRWSGEEPRCESK